MPASTSSAGRARRAAAQLSARRSADRGRRDASAARPPSASRRSTLAALPRAGRVSDFLYDATRHLFAIGYNVDRSPPRRQLLRPARVRSAARELRRDRARASCRRSTGSRSGGCSRASGGAPTLLSWSGSMFEYLMPLLVMPTYDGHAARRRPTTRPSRGRSSTAASAACRGASRSRATTRPTRSSTISTARSACPGSGFKRGLAEDLVDRAVRERAGADGRAGGGVREPRSARRRAASSAPYGFYEAIDYTPSRLPRGQDERDRALVHGAPPGHEPAVARVRAARSADAAPVRLAIPRCRRPTAAAGARAANAARSIRTPPRSARCARRRPKTSATLRVFTTPNTPAPEVQLLSNGRYHVDDHQRRRRLQPLARPRGHALARGSDARLLGHVLLPARRRRAATFWSTAHQPTLQRGRQATRRSSPQGRAEFRRRDDDIDTHIEISVSPEDDIELRRITHHQPRSRRRARIELTSYAEVVLAPPAPMRRIRRSATCSCRPSSSRDRQAILCTRRPRSAERAAAVDVPPDDRARRTTIGADVVRDRSRALHRPRRHAGRSARDATAAPLGDSAGLGARSDASRSATRRARAGRRRCRSTSSPASPRRARRRSRWSRSTATATSPIACSSWRGRTARSCCASSTPPRPMRRLYERLAGAIIYREPDAARAARA